MLKRGAKHTGSKSRSCGPAVNVPIIRSPSERIMADMLSIICFFCASYFLSNISQLRCRTASTSSTSSCLTSFRRPLISFSCGWWKRPCRFGVRTPIWTFVSDEDDETIRRSTLCPPNCRDPGAGEETGLAPGLHTPPRRPGDACGGVSPGTMAGFEGDRNCVSGRGA